MQVFFKEIQSNGAVKELCEIFKAAKTNQVTAIDQVVLQVMSSLICPVYGDFYSFPWKRGPHDSILDYTEAASIFDHLRECIFYGVRESDFIGKTLAIFQSEDESKHFEVKMAALRFLIQMLRSFDGRDSSGG